MKKKRKFVILVAFGTLFAVVVMLNMRLQNKSSTDGIIEIAEVKSGESLSQREGKKIEIFDDNNRKIIEITQAINSKANGIYNVTQNFHAEKCIKEIKNVTTNTTIFEANEETENWKDVEINRQGEKDTVNTYKITMANGYVVERDIKISDFFPDNNRAPSIPQIRISPPDEEEIGINTEVTITAESTDPEGDEIEYIWEGRDKETDWYAYGEHTVKVKAVDIYGSESRQAEYTFTVKRAAPTFRFSNEPEIINGVEWYPVGTVVEIVFGNSETMQKFTGYYATKKGEKYDARYEYSGNMNQTYNTSITISEEGIRTVKAKLVEDETGEESAEIEETVRIIPNAVRRIPEDILIGGMIFKIEMDEVKGAIANNNEPIGTDEYRSDSYMDAAAVHMGLINRGEQGSFLVKVLEPTNKEFIGSTRDGLVSQSSPGEGYYRMVFLDDDGEQIYIPRIEGVEKEINGNNLKITIHAEASGNASIQRYYYRLDDGEYIARGGDYYTFTNVDNTKQHIVRVYVEDSRGLKSLVMIDEKPVIECSQEPKIVNGEKFYPYGETITLHFTEDMTSNMGYYTCKAGEINDDYNYIEASNSVTLDLEPGIYTIRAKRKNFGVGESEELVETINIVNFVNGASVLAINNYIFTNQGIYPVYINNALSGGNLYGTNDYSYDSVISKAAIHWGILKPGESGIVYIRTYSNARDYVGSTRNGITSASLALNGNAEPRFCFVDADGNVIEARDTT